jgi:PTH1 family peptidyl-tRNA hydrolase
VDAPEKFLIVGLGNPGNQYKNSRHNVGFHIVRLFAKKHGMEFKHASQLPGDLAEGGVHHKKVLALLPTTFMNVSGEALRRCLDDFRVPLTHLIVVCDDVALPIGALRMRSQGSCGGHNGLRSIETHVRTQYYARLRVGVGSPGQEILADYVLGRFSEEESRVIAGIEEKAIAVLEVWIMAGIAQAMQATNSAKNDSMKKEEGETNG